MEKNNFSTTYVPLQPPYQIIKYGKDIGMQIGTLIATSKLDGDDEQPFRIETHSYPVVTYRNKFESHSLNPFLKNSFMEGVVWNRVELRDVTTLCFSDTKMTWHQFITLLWTDLARQGVGGTIQYVRSSQLDAMAINILWDDDSEKMKIDFIAHIMSYQMAVVAITNDVNANSEWSIRPETKDEKLIPLVELLKTLKTKDYDIVSLLTNNLLYDKSLSEILELMNAFESKKYNQHP